MMGGEVDGGSISVLPVVALACAFGLLVVGPVVGCLLRRWRAQIRRLDWAVDRAARRCKVALWRVFHPAAARCGRAVQSALDRLDPVVAQRRELGQYLASLPLRSGLTAYEEMARDIDALPAGPAKAAIRDYFRKNVAPPSRECVERARAKQGLPRVPAGVVNALLRGEVPYFMQEAKCERGWL